jgi:CheY-like chemotaxis protein
MVGVVVLAAEDGREGIQIYQERMDEIDLILLDLAMPGLSGQETLKQLREINPAVKVILSSGYSEEEITTEFDFAKDFLQKPYNIDRLIELVDQYLSSD